MVARPLLESWWAFFFDPTTFYLLVRGGVLGICFLFLLFFILFLLSTFSPCIIFIPPKEFVQINILFLPHPPSLQDMFNILFQFWIHTSTIDKLPSVYEFFFNSPSQHRVHHARNAQYVCVCVVELNCICLLGLLCLFSCLFLFSWFFFLINSFYLIFLFIISYHWFPFVNYHLYLRYIDKNYAGTLAVFDRVFGTYREEDLADPPVYGLWVDVRVGIWSFISVVISFSFCLSHFCLSLPFYFFSIPFFLQNPLYQHIQRRGDQHGAAQQVGQERCVAFFVCCFFFSFFIFSFFSFFFLTSALSCQPTTHLLSSTVCACSGSRRAGWSARTSCECPVWPSIILYFLFFFHQIWSYPWFNSHWPPRST